MLPRMNRKLRAAVLGATGVAGQEFLSALVAHPWFEVTRIAASERTAGKRYRDAIRDGAGGQRWYCTGAPSAQYLDMIVEDAAALSGNADGIDLVFSALESDAAKRIEPQLAEKLPVFSTASAFRYEPDVPILVPGVNLDHARLVDLQRRRRGWKGFVAPGPNCTTTGLVIALQPIVKRFGLVRIVMTSLQAVSGAGRSPGVAALDIFDNVIPFIPNEEEKVERETRKILGAVRSEAASGAAGVAIEPLPIRVSCTCTRVGVLDGHTEAVYIETARPAPLDAVREAWASFGSDDQELAKLPSMPARLIEVRDDPYRPQPRLDRDTGDGMTTVIGRLRVDTALGDAPDRGLKFVLLSHNTKMGAAKGSILTAEWLRAAGHF